MNKISLLLISLFFSSIISAQNLDSGIIVYQIKIRVNQEHVKTAKLFFNDSVSLFIYNKIGYDSLQKESSLKTISNKKGSIGEVYIHSSGISEIGYQVYRNYKQKEILIKPSYHILPSDQLCIIKDTWIPIEWHKYNDYKNILGYKTQKAVGKFRGRTYIAWFTPKIPFPYGPSKLFGLPGAILEAYSISKDNKSEKEITFKATKINFSNSTKDKKIHKPKADKTITLKEAVFLIDHMGDMIGIRWNRLAKKINQKTFVRKDKRTTLKDIKIGRKNSMEIIYEWEKFPGDTPNPFGKNLESLIKKINEPPPLLQDNHKNTLPENKESFKN